MCINFFYPLIKEKSLESVLNVMGINGVINYNSDDIRFEKQLDLEKYAGRRTKSGIKLYFEIKYTENEFGKAKHDKEHKDKFNDRYLPLLINTPAINKNYKTRDAFLNNYQIMRNIIHIAEDSYVIFIYPRENKGIEKEALAAKETIIEDGWKNHLILFTWEELVEQIKCNLKSEELINYNDEFCYKYLESDNFNTFANSK